MRNKSGKVRTMTRRAAVLMAWVMALNLLTSVAGTIAFPETVFAYQSISDNSMGMTLDVISSDQSMNSNYGNVNKSYGVIYKNQKEGVIGKGYQNSYEGSYGNLGQVEYNYGKIYYNGLIDGNEKPLVKYNHGTVVANDRGGEITQNEKSGTVISNGETGGYDLGKDIARINKNYGTLYDNMTDGVVDLNYGTILRNKQGGSIDANAEGGIIYTNHGKIRENHGDIGENTVAGTVNFNMGYIGNNIGRVENNKPDRSGKFGNIETNSGRILFNYRDAQVKLNAASGLMDKNEGTVNGNKGRINNNNGTVEGNEGTVATNEEGGVVLNLEGGIVDTNDGDVFNCGGTIGKNNGTEYFSVNIVHNDNVTVTSTGDDNGLISAFGQEWIGETDGKASTATLLVTAEKGYMIPNIPGLDKNFVTAEQQSDGSWLLKITGGSNMTIEIPEPIQAQVGEFPDNTRTVRFNISTKDENQNPIVLEITTVKNVDYNGKKHVSNYSKVNKASASDVSISVNSVSGNNSILSYATPTVKFKNNKNATPSGNIIPDKKKPYFIFNLKANKGATKEQKKLIKLLNKELKTQPVYFGIEPADLSKAAVTAKVDPEKQKITKVIATINDITMKLSKKDYSAEFVDGKAYIVGQGNFKNRQEVRQ